MRNFEDFLGFGRILVDFLSDQASFQTRLANVQQRINPFFCFPKDASKQEPDDWGIFRANIDGWSWRIFFRYLCFLWAAQKSSKSTKMTIKRDKVYFFVVQAWDCFRINEVAGWVSLGRRMLADPMRYLRDAAKLFDFRNTLKQPKLAIFDEMAFFEGSRGR